MTNYRPEASDTKNSVQIFQISSIMLSNSIDDALLDKKLGSTDGAELYSKEVSQYTHTDSNQFQNTFGMAQIGNTLPIFTQMLQRSHLNKGCYGMLHTPLKCNLVNFDIPNGFP